MSVLPINQSQQYQNLQQNGFYQQTDLSDPFYPQNDQHISATNNISQQPPVNNSSSDQQPALFLDPVAVFCFLRIPREQLKIYELSQEGIATSSLAALQEIYNSIPLQFYDLPTTKDLFSLNYVDKQILQPLSQANPQVLSSIISAGKVIDASRFLHAQIRKRSMNLFIMIAIVMILTLACEATYFIEINLNFSSYYMLILNILGNIFLGAEFIMTYQGVNNGNLRILKLAYCLSTMNIIYSLVLLFVGIYYTYNQTKTSAFIILIQTLACLFGVCAVLTQIAQYNIRYYMTRLLVLLKKVDENELKKKI